MPRAQVFPAHAPSPRPTGARAAESLSRPVVRPSSVAPPGVTPLRLFASFDESDNSPGASCRPRRGSASSTSSYDSDSCDNGLPMPSPPPSPRAGSRRWDKNVVEDRSRSRSRESSEPPSPPPSPSVCGFGNESGFSSELKIDYGTTVDERWIPAVGRIKVRCCGKNWGLLALWRCSLMAFCASLILVIYVICHTVSEQTAREELAREALIQDESPAPSPMRPSLPQLPPVCKDEQTNCRQLASFGCDYNLTHMGWEGSIADRCPVTCDACGDEGPIQGQSDTTCSDDDNAAAIEAVGFDCKTVVSERACVLVYHFCKCSCDPNNHPPENKAVVEVASCQKVAGYMPPVLGALAGHDMHLAAEKARELVSNATSAEQCGLICRMMEGTSIKGDSAYGMMTRRYCFSFDWSEIQKECLIGTGTVSRGEPGEHGHGKLDHNATKYCYYERLWKQEIRSLTGFSAKRNPLIGRLVQVTGLVTSVVASHPQGRAEGQFYRQGFFIQQVGVDAECRDPVPALFVHTNRFVPSVGKLVEVTGVAFVFGDQVELTDLVLRLTHKLDGDILTSATKTTLAKIKAQRCEALLVEVTGTCIAPEVNNDGVWAIQDGTGIASVLVNRDNHLFVDNVPGGSTKQRVTAGKTYRVVGIVILVKEQIFIQTSSRATIADTG